jgi:uncharacterized protein (TIGR04222 family)
LAATFADFMFSLRGPEFLVLFAAFAVVVYFIVEALITAREMRLPSDPRIRDPYVIAYLRGQERELLRVVAVSLVFRRLLAVEGGTFLTIDRSEVDRVQPSVEQQVLRLCQKPYSAPGLIADLGFLKAAATYHGDLVRRGLIASDAVKRDRWLPVFAGIACLLVIAIIKIKVATATGHSNIGFLLVLTLVAAFGLWRRGQAHRTVAGSTALKNLKVLFDSLQRCWWRFPKVNGPSEAALLAAVFGVYAVAGFDNFSWSRMFPNPGDSRGGSGCGSSGGCGGGGGGCGGCGS